MKIKTKCIYRGCADFGRFVSTDAKNKNKNKQKTRIFSAAQKICTAEPTLEAAVAVHMM